MALARDHHAAGGSPPSMMRKRLKSRRKDLGIVEREKKSTLKIGKNKPRHPSRPENASKRSSAKKGW
jgi:hypothetical protein